MHKTFEYRLFVNRSQHAMLLSCLAESRQLYNEMLEMVKAHYDETGKYLRGRANRLATFHTWQLPERLHSLPPIP